MLQFIILLQDNLLSNEMNIHGEKIQRAYSYVNALQNYKLEFYIISVPNGKLSHALWQ
nr:hypothetical protein [secondary endosymbiont of Trabutina mannipara]